jgi:AcrR family transcriptional regulator
MKQACLKQSVVSQGPACNKGVIFRLIERGRMARKPRAVEDRREQIIDAAMRVFARKGFLRATNKDIADEIDITPGLIYHYFENKEAVLRAIIENRSPMRIVRTLPAEAFEMPPAAFLSFVISQVLNVLENERFVQFIHILVPELIQHPELISKVGQALQQTLQIISTYLETQMAKGVLRRADAAMTVQVLVGSVMGFVLRRQMLHDPSALAYTHEQIVEAVVDTVLQGLLPR